MRYSALTCLLLVSLTSGCATKPEPMVVTEYRMQYVPDSLLTVCPKTEWKGGTYRGVAALAEARGTDVDNCNARLESIRDFQAKQRAKDAKK